MNVESLPAARVREIGEYILGRADDLVERWASISQRENADAADEQRTALKNHLPRFLTQYGQGLIDLDERVPLRHAIEHGLQRWELGWEIESLVRDFQILRRVIVSGLQIDIALGVDEAMMIASTLDEAVATSIAAYVAQRESELAGTNEELRRSNHELKRFAHIVAHEIRAPFSQILVETARLRSLLGEAPEEGGEALSSIDDSVAAVKDVIRTLLHYADLEIDGDLEPEQVDLNQVLKRACENLSSLIEETSARISADDLPIVFGRRLPLQSVFQNLIENALKYCSSEPPRVQVRASKREDGCCEIRFQDNGLGIEPKHHESIFRFLHRAHPHLDIPGTGIGLAMCRRIAQQHDGTIVVESTPGEGSTFILTLCASAD